MRPKSPTIVFAGLIAVTCLAAEAAAVGPVLKNADFSQESNGQFVGWSAVGRYTPENKAARVECDSRHPAGGLVQIVRCDPPIAEPFTASARAKTVGVGGEGDFAVWLDLIHADGSPSWGHVAGFARGTHDWARASVDVVPVKPVAEIRFHLLLRNTAGTAWFTEPRVGLTPLTFRQQEAIVGLWGPDSLSIRAGTNLPAVIEAHGLPAPASQPTSIGPSRWLAVDLAHASREVLARPIKITAHAVGRPENQSSIEIVPCVRAHDPDAGREVRAWTTDSMTRVFTDSLPPLDGRADQPLLMDAARSGHVSLQVAVAARPDGSARQAQVSMGDLTTSEGGVLSGHVWQRYRVGFIRNEQPALHPNLERPGPTWWPDVLLEWRAMSIPAGQTRSAVLTARIPAGQQPGLYEGHINVSTADGVTRRFPVQLRIHPFAIPERLRIKTAFALMDGFLEKIYGHITPKLRRAYTAFALDHRLNPDDISRTRLPDLDELAWARDRGLNAFNILNLVPEPSQSATWVCFGQTKDYTPAFKKRLTERLDAVVPELEKRGLLDLAYVYGFDERGEEYIPIMREYFGLIKQRYPRIHTLSTCWPPAGTDPASLNIDWYCPLSNKYDPATAEKVRARGGEMWWYICCGPTWPYANWMFEYPLAEGRLIWWQAWHEKVDGFLYWGLNIWDRPFDDRPIPDDADALLKWSVTPFEPLHGDGVLLYPGAKGPLGSLRLLNIRDGLEDTAILDAAERRVGRHRVESVVREVSRGMADFTRDPSVLYAARGKLVQVLATTGDAAKP